MTTITSEKVIINVPCHEVYNLLCNFNNYQQLMPPQVTDWKSDDNSGSFTIKDMASIGLEITQRVPHQKIVMDKTHAPFPLTLSCMVQEVNDNLASSLVIELQADMNAFLKMMAVKPLTNFVNILATNCKRILEDGVQA